MGVGGQRHAPGCFTHGEVTRNPLYRMTGGSQIQSGQVRITSALAGFDPQAVQPVAICYIDYADPAHSNKYVSKWG